MAITEKILYSNNALSTLAAGINDIVTTLTIQAGHGTRFASPGAGECFIITLRDAAGTKMERCKCTTRSTDTFSNLTRGIDGTTAQNWASGDKVEIRLGKLELEQFVQQDGRNLFTVAGGTADSLTATFSPAFSSLINGMQVRVRAAAANATATPTFSPDGLTAKTIVDPKGNALVAGSISGSSHEMILRYNSVLDKWILLNPAILPVNMGGTGSTTAAAARAALGAADDTNTMHLTGNETAAGNKTLTGNTALAGPAFMGDTMSLTADISPAQITADQNDYNPTGLSTSSILRLSSDALRSITGLAGGADGRIITILNVGAQLITLKDDDAGSTAANRFALPGDVVLLPDESVELWYDATSSRWRIKSRFQNDNRTWQTMAVGVDRSAGVNYQNISGRQITVSVRANPNNPIGAPGSINGFVGSTNPATKNIDANLGHGDGAGSPKTFYGGVTLEVPHLWWFRVDIAGYSIGTWEELR